MDIYWRINKVECNIYIIRVDERCNKGGAIIN